MQAGVRLMVWGEVKVTFGKAKVISSPAGLVLCGVQQCWIHGEAQQEGHQGWLLYTATYLYLLLIYLYLLLITLCIYLLPGLASGRSLAGLASKGGWLTT